MCTKPLKGFKYGKTVNGKDNYIITSYDIDHVEITGDSTVNRVVTSTRRFDDSLVIREFTEIPCGQCMECRLEYSRQWANRCLLESKDHEKNCFITLTYDQQYLPRKKDCVKPKTGEVVDMNTLVKKDLQLFFKRLRKELDKQGIKIRYFACGEYGDQTERPHYHAIVFGWYPDDITINEVKDSSGLGYRYYQSETLSRIWPQGIHVVADCTWETCAYVARYVCKKVKGIDKQLFDKIGIENQFVTMSRRPGIGLNWFNSHIDCYANFLNTYVGTDFGNRKISHNRYFDSKLEEIDPELIEELKLIRKEFQKDKNRAELSNTSLPYLKYLDVKDSNLLKKTKGLIREL